MMNQKQPKYKSKYENEVAQILGSLVKYETDILYYIVPETIRKYNPDFTFKSKKPIYLETKGKWTPEDRKKHVLLKEQYPDIKIVLLFQDASKRISKKSKTTYGEWATKHNLTWLDYRTIEKENLYESIKNV